MALAQCHLLLLLREEQRLAERRKPPGMLLLAPLHRTACAVPLKRRWHWAWAAWSPNPDHSRPFVGVPTLVGVWLRLGRLKPVHQRAHGENRVIAISLDFIERYR